MHTVVSLYVQLYFYIILGQGVIRIALHVYELHARHQAPNAPRTMTTLYIKRTSLLLFLEWPLLR